MVYTCKGFDYGNYFIFYYESTKEFMFELERQFRLAEDIIKYMTIKREDYKMFIRRKDYLRLRDEEKN